jgi:cell division protein FtsB
MNRIIAGYEVSFHTVKKQEAYTKRDFFKKRVMLKLLVLIGFTVLLALFYTWSRTQVVQIGYDINDYKSEQNRLKDENKRLKMEIALMRSPHMLKALAQTKLGLLPPGQERIVNIE